MLFRSEKRSKKVKSEEEICQIGTISANGDSEIGDMISQEIRRASCRERV